MGTNFNLKGTDLLKDLGINGRMLLKIIVQKSDVSVYTRFNWQQTVRTRTSESCIDE
jgi:hypothetical protein